MGEKALVVPFLMPTMRRSLELGDAIDEQERVAVRENPCNRVVFEGSVSGVIDPESIIPASPGDQPQMRLQIPHE